MFVKKYGNGKRIFAGFHGWSGDHRTFEPLMKYLPENSSFYSFDLPGAGKSPAPERWTRENIEKILQESLQSIELEQITLVGNCSGAILSLLIAKQDAEKITRLVLIDPFAYLPWYFSIFLNKYFGKKTYMLTFANKFGRAITNSVLKYRRTKKSNLTNSFTSVNHNTVYEYLKLLSSMGKPEQFGGLNQPIDIIYGRKTFRAVKKSINIWKEIFPNAIAHELPEAGHLPIEESPYKLSNIIFHKYNNS